MLTSPWTHCRRGLPKAGSSSNQLSSNLLSFSASPWTIRQSLNFLPFSNGTVLLCSERLCSTGTAFPSRSNVQPFPGHAEGVFPSPSHVKSFAFYLFLLYFFPVLKHCSESPWQNSPLSPSGCSFLVLLPPTASVWAAQGWAWHLLFCVVKFFMSLWRSERNQGSIYNHLRVITGCHIWVYFRNSFMKSHLQVVKH